MPFCLTQLSIKETFSEVFGIMKGQHVGGRSSERSYSNHFRLTMATNFCTSSETQADAHSLPMPRVLNHGDSTSKSRNPPPPP